MNFTEEDFPSLGSQSIKQQGTEGVPPEPATKATEDPYAGMTKSQKKRAKKKEIEDYRRARVKMDINIQKLQSMIGVHMNS